MKAHSPLSMAQCLMILLLMLAASCSKNSSADGSDLLKTVPSDAGMVILADINSLLEKSGSKVRDMGEVELSASLSGALSAVSDPSLRGNLMTLFSGEAGVAHSSAVIFSEGSDVYATFMIDNPDAFNAYAERYTGEKFTASGDLNLCGSVAVIANQGWMRFSNTAPLQATEIQKFSRLSESQSFLSNDISKRMLEADKDIVSWFDIDAMLNISGRSFSDRTMSRMALSSLFDDAAYLFGSADFGKKELKMDFSVISSKGKDARCNLPTSKIDVKTVESLGGDAAFVMAVAVSPALVKQIEKIAASFGGGIAAQYSSLFKPLDGTSAFAIADASQRESVSAVVTVNDQPVGDLTTMLNSFGTVKRDGKYLRIESQLKGAGIPVADAAGKFSGAWLGMAVDGSVLSSNPGYAGAFKNMYILISPDGDSLKIKMELATPDGENSLVSLLKSLSR